MSPYIVPSCTPVVARLGSMLSLALLFTSAVVTAQNISPQKNNEITNEELRNLNKPTGLDLKWEYAGIIFLLYKPILRTAFRCGLFFPDPVDAAALPIAPLLIFNSTWAADECPSADTERYSMFCDSIVRTEIARHSYRFFL